MDLDKDRLAKLLSMTESGHDGEALAAIRKANRLLREHNRSWTDVLGTTAHPAAASASRRMQGDERREHARGAGRTAPTYQRTRQYRNAFRREPFLSRLLGFPFWIVVELLALINPHMQINTHGAIITLVFALSMLFGIASWFGLGYLLLFSLA